MSKRSSKNIEKRPFWLDTVREEIDQLGPDDFILPTAEIDPVKDLVAGPASIQARKLYSLSLGYEKKAAERGIEGRYEQDAKQRDFLLNLALEYQSKSDVLIKIFWGAIEDEYNLWSKASVGIRSGWIVVYSERKEDPPKPPFEDFLRKMFGGSEQ